MVGETSSGRLRAIPFFDFSTRPFAIIIPDMAKREPFNPLLIKAPADATAAATASGPLSVSQLTARIKQAIELALPATVHVLGEISNFKRHSSGHLYLTLKDAGSELSCVMWKSDAAKLKFTPADGLEVIATGTVEVFERAGRYQLYIRKIEPRGIGALELAFRQLCDKLAREGLFDPGRKRPLPEFPRRIALVTSPTGAAVGDMLRTIARRYPCVDVLLYPVRVQGDGAAAEIARAIGKLNEHAAALGGIDVLIVGRGGGSIEDLWAFNEEVVARAIAASTIPTVSAVGHEVDVTVADLVADVRAATPTAAAEIAVPLRADILESVAQLAVRMHRMVTAKWGLLSARLHGLEQRVEFRDPLSLLRRRGQLVDELDSRMQRHLVERLRKLRRQMDVLEPMMQRIAPHAVLLRTLVRLRDAELRLAAASPMALATRLRQRMEHVESDVKLALRHRLALAAKAIEYQDSRLAALSYKSVLGRGFAITRTARGRAVVRSISELRDGQRVVTEVMDGTFESEVINLRQLELFGTRNGQETDI